MTTLSDAKLATHLRSLEEQLLDPAVRTNPQSVAAYPAGDFREFGSSGLVPDLAPVTYSSHRHHTDGTTISALRSSLWVHRTERWQLLFHRATRE